MPKYRVTNRITGEQFEVEAPYAQDACDQLGWTIGDCHVKVLREGPFADLSQRPMKLKEAKRER